MAVSIQIRDVPEQIRDRILGHAADSGQSMQGYLLDVLTHLAARPTKVAWDALAAVRAQAPVNMNIVLEIIREGRDEGPNAGEYPR